MRRLRTRCRASHLAVGAVLEIEDTAITSAFKRGEALRQRFGILRSRGSIADEDRTSMHQLLEGSK